MKNGLHIDEHGNNYWYLDDKLHREDGPAAVSADGSEFWYLDGKLHRLDGPAEEWAGGQKCWYLNGNSHREDGPAAIWADGSEFWWLQDNCNCLGGGAEGFWAHWEKLNHTQRCNLNLHFWLAKYS